MSKFPSNEEVSEIFQILDQQKHRLENQMICLHRFINNYNNKTGIEPISGLPVTNMPVFFSNRNSIYIDKIVNHKANQPLSTFESQLCSCLNPKSGTLTNLDTINTFMNLVSQSNTLYERMLIIKVIEHVSLPIVMRKLCHENLFRFINLWLNEYRNNEATYSVAHEILLCLNTIWIDSTILIKNSNDLPKTVAKIAKQNTPELSPLATEIKGKWMVILKNRNTKSNTTESIPKKRISEETNSDIKKQILESNDTKNTKESDNTPASTPASTPEITPVTTPAITPASTSEIKNKVEENISLNTSIPVKTPQIPKKKRVSFKPDTELEEVFIIEDEDHKTFKSFKASVKEEKNSEASLFKNHIHASEDLHDFEDINKNNTELSSISNTLPMESNSKASSVFINSSETKTDKDIAIANENTISSTSSVSTTATTATTATPTATTHVPVAPVPASIPIPVSTTSSSTVSNVSPTLQPTSLNQNHIYMNANTTTTSTLPSITTNTSSTISSTSSAYMNKNTTQTNSNPYENYNTRNTYNMDRNRNINEQYNNNYRNNYQNNNYNSYQNNNYNNYQNKNKYDSYKNQSYSSTYTREQDTLNPRSPPANHMSPPGRPINPQNYNNNSNYYQPNSNIPPSQRYVTQPYPKQFLDYIYVYKDLFRSKLGTFKVTSLPDAPSLGPVSGCKAREEDILNALHIVDPPKNVYPR